jgi:glycosyltransferase involved in cell wall biosynthesis
MTWWTIKKLVRDGFRRIKNPALEQWDHLRFRLDSTAQSSAKAESFTVLFVGEGINYRVLRFAKWLHKKGRAECTLLFRRGMGRFPEEFRACFRSVATYRSHWDLACRLKQLSGTSVIHAYGPPSYPAQAAIRFSDKPVTFDLYDVRVIYFGFDEARCPIPWMRRKWIKQDVPVEKFCFENADGVVARSLENRAAIRDYHFNVKAPRVFVPDYCDDENWISPQDAVVRERRPLSEGIHLVYAGGVAPKSAPRAFYGFIHFHPEIEAITAQGMHLHIYPAGEWDSLQEYREIAASNPFFHFHRPVAQSELPKTLAQYHFGMIPIFRKEGVTLHPYKMTYATSLKFFNFLEAGLPVICSDDLRYQGWLTRHYRLGLTIKRAELSDLRRRLEGLDYPGLVQKVTEAREKFALSRHIQRLHGHYLQFVTQGNAKHDTIIRDDDQGNGAVEGFRAQQHQNSRSTQ